MTWERQRRGIRQPGATPRVKWSPFIGPISGRFMSWSGVWKSPLMSLSSWLSRRFCGACGLLAWPYQRHRWSSTSSMPHERARPRAYYPRGRWGQVFLCVVIHPPGVRCERWLIRNDSVGSVVLARSASQSLPPQTESLRRAPVKLVTTWVRVPPVELDGSRPKHDVRDEAARPNHKRDVDGTVGLQRR